MTAQMNTPDREPREKTREPVTRPVRAASDREAIEELLRQSQQVRIGGGA